MVELGPTDEGMKNGHMAKDCPYKVNIANTADRYNHYIHGPCGTENSELTKEEFDTLVEHKNGNHEENEQWECPICRFDVEKWRQAQMTDYELVPLKNEPQDATPIGWKESGR